jgi:hypothetical protein
MTDPFPSLPPLGKKNPEEAEGIGKSTKPLELAPAQVNIQLAFQCDNFRRRIRSGSKAGPEENPGIPYQSPNTLKGLHEKSKYPNHCSQNVPRNRPTTKTRNSLKINLHRIFHQYNHRVCSDDCFFGCDGLIATHTCLRERSC